MAEREEEGREEEEEEKERRGRGNSTESGRQGGRQRKKERERETRLRGGEGKPPDQTRASRSSTRLHSFFHRPHLSRDGHCTGDESFTAIAWGRGREDALSGDV